MSKKYQEIEEKHRNFIEAQKMFFVATAAPDGLINLSPKGLDSLRVMDKNRIIWLNLTGSGNETAAHLLENPRMTLMFCAFEDNPLILRLYGQAKAYHPRDEAWNELIGHFPALSGARQIFDLKIELVQTSCGFAVPLYEYQGQRQILLDWADKKGEEGVQEYWQEKNQLSLDGKSTGIFE